MKRFGFFMSLLVASSFFIAGCGSSSSTDPVVDTPQTIAIDKIGAYAEDQTQPVPSVEDYLAAGVEGVTTDNLDDINALVASLTADDVDTPEEIQAILNDNGLTIVDPNEPVNTAPVSNAGVDQSAGTTETVTLDGSASSDADSDAITYLWSLTLPSGSTTTLSSTTVVSPTFVADVAGIYVATLVVNDGTVNSNADTVTITVTDAALVNTAPVAIATADTTSVNITTTPNALITLDGSTSSDADADSITHAWSLTVPTGSAAVLSSTTAVSPTFNVDIIGSYVATLVVNDGTVDSTADTVTVIVTDGTVDAIAGRTIEYADASVSDSKFSFYQNGKFVKTICSGACSAGTGTFDYIGTWTEAAGVYTLKDANDITITQGVETANYPTTNYPVVADKDNTDPNVANVQGDGIREKNDNGITHVYFRDPDLSGLVAFSAFGFDIPTWSPTGGGGHWNTTADGKVYAFYGTDVNAEIATYAFDREPGIGITGNIITVTKAGDLMNVIVVDEYWQLKPPATDLVKTTPVVAPATMVEATFYDKLMLITDKTDGPSACYYDIPLSDIVNGFVICAGVSIDGIPWGSKGDNWYINAEDDLEIKLHYDGPDNQSTTEIYRFEDASPAQGTLISEYNKEGVFQTTSSISRFSDYK